MPKLSSPWTCSRAIAILGVPVLLPLVMYALIPACSTGSKASFVSLAYGYLPLVLAGNLAHYLRLGLGEAGTILPLSFSTFRLSGQDLPVVVAHPAVIAFLQGSVLVVGVIWSVFVTQKVGKQSLLKLWPQHLAIAVFALGMGQLIVG